MTRAPIAPDRATRRLSRRTVAWVSERSRRREWSLGNPGEAPRPWARPTRKAGTCRMLAGPGRRRSPPRRWSPRRRSCRRGPRAPTTRTRSSCSRTTSSRCRTRWPTGTTTPSAREGSRRSWKSSPATRSWRRSRTRPPRTRSEKGELPMNTKFRRTAALCAASVPAAGLALVAGFSQTLYASGSCFDPTLQLFTQNSPASTSSKGDAQVSLKVKPPFVLEGASSANGYLDSDSGASGANAMGSVVRFYTPTCPGWSYAWAARGTVVGELKAKASKTAPGSALATCSFSASAGGDISPPAYSAKVASNATQGGGSVSFTVSTTPPNVSYTIGQTQLTQTISPSTNAGGDAKVLFDGPK